MSEPHSTATAAPAALVWRLLAMLYDSLPVIALWLATSAVVMALHGNEPLVPLSTGQFGLFALCWAVSGGYFVWSWARGGQTLGMRPWRLQVLAYDGGRASWRALCLRYLIASVSLLVAGLGFWWSLFEPERRTWHDLGSRTRLVRRPR